MSLITNSWEGAMELNKRKTERSRYIPFIREFLKPAIKNKLIL
jgi:hypothetical protein